MLCEICSVPCIPGARGRKPRFCSTRCRVASHRKNVFPPELMALPRWVRHKSKRPLHPEGYWIAVTHAPSWSSYQVAKASRYGDGLGFVLNGDGIVCIDLDHCVQDGVLSAEAERILDSLPETYIEISPSGTGLHIWGLAKMDSGRRFTRNGQSVEIYPSGRFITMTGKAITRAPLAQLPIDTLVQG